MAVAKHDTGQAPTPAAAMATAAVRSLSPYAPGKPLSELQRELGLTDIIKLASNENPLGPSPRAVAAMQAALPDVWLYPDGSGHELKTALSRALQVSPAQITLGNGSNDLLVLLAEAFLTPEMSSVYSQYAFAYYHLVSRATGAQERVARALPLDSAMPLGHDLDAMRELIDASTRLVFIANPNNPTGSWAPEARVRAFLRSVPAGTLVVLDEAYFEFARSSGCEDAVPWVHEHPNLVVLRTFSKAYGLAGMRVGYAVSHPDVADVLNRIRPAFNVGHVSMAGAVAALADAAHVAAGVTLALEGREFFNAELPKLGLHVVPSAANFVLVRFGANAMQVFDALLRAGIIVRPMHGYGLPEYLRISCGTPEQNTRLVRALGAILGKGGRAS